MKLYVWYCPTLDSLHLSSTKYGVWVAKPRYEGPFPVRIKFEKCFYVGEL